MSKYRIIVKNSFPARVVAVVSGRTPEDAIKRFKRQFWLPGSYIAVPV